VDSADEITYDERWVGAGEPRWRGHQPTRAELEALGSQVRVLEGLNHTRTMQAVHVLPILRSWLVDRLACECRG